MRVLLYNFVQTDEPAGKEGGGVALYQRNLVQALTDAGHEVICLSSGDRYSLRRRPPRLVCRRMGAAHQAIIYDSPVFAPAHAAFSALSAYTESSALDPIAFELKARFGEIDVLHFQNLEGLTAGFLRACREAFPDARILLSAHNYNLVCPQVNLWFRERSVCEDARDGNACVNCLTAPDRLPFELNKRRMEAILRPLGLGLMDPAAQPVIGAVRGAAAIAKAGRRRIVRLRPKPRARRRLVITDEHAARPYRDFREVNLRLVEEVFDQVLAVSQRTREVLVARGVPAAKVGVSYIGTRHYEAFKSARRRWDIGEDLHVAFFGYMRADKGFYFLLRSLRHLPPEVAGRLRLTIAAPVRDAWPIDQLKAMAHKFKAVVVHDGYTQATIPKLLEDVDLGLVPVLWEDNLPQVAIEFVAHGVPILTSDRGGAQEVGGRHAQFVFRAGSSGDLCAKLGDIALGRTRLASFWSQTPQIFSMADHVEDLMRFYAPEAAGRADWRGEPAAQARA